MSDKNRSTISLIQCQMFKDLWVVLYLFEHRANAEIIRALLNKVKNLSRQRQLLLLPCIVYVFQNHPNKHVERFLYELCEPSYEAYLIIKWSFNAYTLKKTVSPIKAEDFQDMRNHMDSHIINGKQLNLRDLAAEDVAEFVGKWAEHKEQRSNFVSLMSDFYESLTKICLRLKKHPVGQRNTSLTHYLQKYFLKHIKKTQTFCKELALGTFFPTLQPSNFIVNILFELCYTFTTKERVPYKLVFETVDYDELVNSPVSKYDILQSIPKETAEELENDSDVSVIDSDSFNKKEKELASKLMEYMKEVQRKSSVVQDDKETIMVDPPKIEKLKLKHSYFDEDWEEKVSKFRERSPYKSLSSYRVRAYLVKAGDDLRQQYFAMQLIKLTKNIIDQLNIPLWIKPYSVIMFNRNEGFIEYLPNTMTVSSLKKFGSRNLIQIYRQIFGDQWDVASKNFTNSLAGYSLVSYLFLIKDRHNGNILIDSDGHILHIDFSFLFGISPGNMNFEKAPFKLTQQYIDLMGGLNSDMFNYFKELLFLGFTSMKRHGHDIVKYIEVVRENSDFPCFRYYNRADLEKRMMLKATDEEIRNNIENLIYYSANAPTTRSYDRFQEYSNGIRR